MSEQEQTQDHNGTEQSKLDFEQLMKTDETFKKFVESYGDRRATQATKTAAERVSQEYNAKLEAERLRKLEEEKQWQLVAKEREKQLEELNSKLKMKELDEQTLKLARELDLMDFVDAVGSIPSLEARLETMKTIKERLNVSVSKTVSQKLTTPAAPGKTNEVKKLTIDEVLADPSKINDYYKQENIKFR